MMWTDSKNDEGGILINVNWENVMIAVILSGLIGYIFKDIFFAMILIVVMVMCMSIVMLVKLIKEK